jgi:hypothetical protein
MQSLKKGINGILGGDSQGKSNSIIETVLSAM